MDVQRDAVQPTFRLAQMCRATKKAMQLHGRAGVSLRILPTILRHFYPQLQRDDRTVCSYAAVVAYRDARAPWAVQQYFPAELRPTGIRKRTPVDRSTPWKLVQCDLPAASSPPEHALPDNPRQGMTTTKTQTPPCEPIPVASPAKIMSDLASVTDESSSTDTEPEEVAPRPRSVVERQPSSGRRDAPSHRRHEQRDNRREAEHRHRRPTATMDTARELQRRIDSLQRQLDESRRCPPSRHHERSHPCRHGSPAGRLVRGAYHRR